MGSCIGYLISESGREFMRFLAEPPPSEVFEELRETCSLYDAVLINSNQEILVELTGCITIVWLPIKASTVVADPDAHQIVSDWENSLITICKSYIMQVDEFTLELCPEYRDLWFRDIENSRLVIAWMREQSDTRIVSLSQLDNHQF